MSIINHLIMKFFISSFPVFSYGFFSEGKSFQNLKVWSPDPVKIHYSSGDFAKYKTLNVCPFKVVSFSIVDVFQTTIEFSE